MRTFILIELLEEIRSNLFHSFEKLRKSGVLIGEFTPLDNFVLILDFLGTLSNEDILKVTSKLKEISFPSFDLGIGELSFSPSKSHVNTISIEIVSEKLDLFCEEISKKLSELDFDFEGFDSKIVIAKIKEIRDMDSFWKKIDSLKIKKSSFNVKEFLLVKSELTSRGIFYKKLESFPLKEEI